MNISPYDNLPVGNKEPQQEEAQQPENLQYVDVPIEEPAEDIPPEKPESEESAKPIADIDENIEIILPEIPQTHTIDETQAESQQETVLKDDFETQHPAVIPSQPSGKASAEPAPIQRESRDFTKITPLTSSSQYSKLKLRNMWDAKEYVLPFEETLLVPDTMPDMGSVLFAEGNIALSQPGKASYEKSDPVSGEIIVYTVYKPTDSADSPVDVIKSSIPFKTDKCWENTEGSTFKISVSIKTISAEMLNERKFTVKGNISIRFIEIIQKDLMLFNGIGDNDLIQKSSSLNASDLIFETTETTEISQEINIHEEQPSPVKILKEHFNIIENHKQITSGKLVINGTILSEILYLGQEDGEEKLCSLKNKTDFTQFIIIDENIDTDLIQTSFNNDGLKTTIENQNQFLLQGKILTVICGYENKNIPIVSDAYHKNQDIKFDISSQPLSSIEGTVSGEVSAREIVNIEETDKKPETLLCGSGRITEITGNSERGRIIIEGNVAVKILALDENKVPFVIDSTVPLRGSLEMSDAAEGLNINVSAAVKEFWFDSINSRQLEINIGVSLEVWAIGQKNFTTLENLCFTETKTPKKRVSMAIYVVGGTDTMWDIAKRYKTDIESLVQLNQLDAEKPLTEGTKLLIMK